MIASGRTITQAIHNWTSLLPLPGLTVIPLAVGVTSLGIVSGTMVAGDVGVAAVTGEAESPAGPTAGMGDTEDAAVVNEGPEGFSSVGLASRDPTLKSNKKLC